MNRNRLQSLFSFALYIVCLLWAETTMAQVEILTTQTGTATLSVALAADTDTTGLSNSEIQILEHEVQLTLPFSGTPNDTLVVQLGLSGWGGYDLLTRRFPLNQTGAFDDGCSLTITGNGMAVGLGKYTGLSSFHARAYLTSAGIGSAVTAP